MLIISTLLFIVILLFTTLSTIHRIKLFSDDYVTVGRVLEGYVAIVGVLLGLVIFIGLNTFFPNINHIASKVVAVVAWFVVTLLLYTVPNNNNETLMEFLWEKYSTDRRKLFSSMLLFLGLLFTFIALPVFGWVWVGIVLILTIVLPILTIGLTYGLDQAIEHTRVDEN